MNKMTHEVALGGVYFAPLLLAFILGIFLAWFTARLLNKLKLSKYFFYPPLVFVALTVIYTVLIGKFVVRV